MDPSVGDISPIIIAAFVLGLIVAGVGLWAFS